MTQVTHTAGAISVDEVALAEAAELFHPARPRHVTAITVEFDDGAAATVPQRLTEFIAAVLQSMSTGAGVSTTVLPRQLTTTVAADLIGVSRPTLMKMIERGDLRAHKVGSHHRLDRDAVITLRDERHAARRAAMQELLEAGEAFDQTD